MMRTRTLHDVAACACGLASSTQSADASLARVAEVLFGGVETAPDQAARLVKQFELKRVAVHEAAHGVVGRHFGQSIRFLRASPTAGVTQFAAGGFRGNDVERPAALLSLAGLAAERMVNGDELRLGSAEITHRLRLPRLAGPDLCDLCDLARTLRLSQPTLDEAGYLKLVRAYQNEINSLVREPAIAAGILLVADHLAKDGFLTGARIEELLGTHSAPRSSAAPPKSPGVTVRVERLKEPIFATRMGIGGTWTRGAAS